MGLGSLGLGLSSALLSGRGPGAWGPEKGPKNADLYQPGSKYFVLQWSRGLGHLGLRFSGLCVVQGVALAASSYLALQVASWNHGFPEPRNNQHVYERAPSEMRDSSTSRQTPCGLSTCNSEPGTSASPIYSGVGSSI